MVSVTTDVLPWHSAPVTAKTADIAMSAPEPEATGFQPFGDDGFSFFDLIDVINPLQHIPIIGPMYRELTDDSIGPLPRIAGSTLFFGPIGAGMAAADVVLQETTGKDAGEHVLAMLRKEVPTQTAAAAEAAPGVGAAGTDGDDPVTAWLQAEAAYRKQLTEAQGEPKRPAANAAASAEPAPAATESVTDWARAELAYRAALTAAPAVETAALAETPNRAAPARTPPGATAAAGGWFTDVMLGALNRYDAMQGPAQDDDTDTASANRRRTLN